MLAVNDQEFFFRFLQAADALGAIDSIEAEFLRRKEQDGAGNGGLGDGRLVKIANRFHFRL